MAGDIYVTFGGDTAGLEASIASAKASVRDFSSELQALARQMQATGAGADSELGQQMLAAATRLVAAKAAVSDLKGELGGLGGAAGGGGPGGIANSLTSMLAPIAAVRSSIGGFIELFAAAFAVEKVKEFVQSMGELGEQTERTSEILGLSTRQVGELQYVFAATGTPIENLDLMMGRFEVSLSRPATSANTVVAGLKALGLSAQELIGLPLPQQLEKIAQATSSFADGVNKTAALQALGRGFVELIPLLDQGAAGFDELKAKADATNSTLDATATHALAEMNTGFTELGASIKGDAVAAFEPFIGAVNGAVAIMTSLAQGFSSAIAQGGVVRDMLDLVADAFKIVETAVVLGIDVLKNFSAAGQTAALIVSEGIKGLAGITSAVISAMAEMWTAFWGGLIKGASDAIHQVGEMLSSLAAAGSAAMHFDFSAATGALGQIKGEVAGVGTAIASAFQIPKFDTAGIDSAFKTTRDAMVSYGQMGNDAVIRHDTEAKAQLDKIWGTGGDRRNEPGNQGANNMAPPAPALDLARQGGGKGKGAGQNDALKSAEDEANAEVKLTQDAYKLEETALNEKLKTGQINMATWLTSTKDALGDELQDTLAVYQQEEGLAGLKTSQIVALKAKEAEAIASYNQQILAAESKAAEATAQQWQSAFNSINNALTSQTSGLLSGTTTWAQAMRNILDSLATDGINDAMKWALAWIENQIKVALGIGVVKSAQESADVSTAATAAVSAQTGLLASIGADAAKVFGGIFGFLAPVMGPAAAGPATAGSAAVMAVAGGIGHMATGVWNLPSDMLSVIHQGEMVVPSTFASGLRGAVASGSGDSSGGGAGGLTVHFSPNVTAIDAAGVQAFLGQYAPQFAKSIYTYMNRNPSSFP